jgi:UDP-N-acetylmuramoyl-L-alanyl-D-glutamate--2,6-diaminopimelate ligase
MIKDTKILFKGINIIDSAGRIPKEINQIHFDSRKVSKNDMFIAISGTQVDGHSFIEGVIEKGASLVVCEILPEAIDPNISYIKVENTTLALAILSANYYDNPSKKLKLVGITGTNGKTSTVTMLYNMHLELGYACGLLSTVRNLINGKEINATHTTPDAIQINNLLDQMVSEGCDYCFMEVSSHALTQNRTAGLHFAGAIFSNITHDHLDYHGTFLEYIKAKKILFDNLNKDAFALINIDDKNAKIMTQNTLAKVSSFSIQSMADYQAKVLENTFEGLHLQINGKNLWIPLVGRFNASNLLAVYGTAILLGHEQEEVLRILSGIKSAEGRFDAIRSKKGIVAIIDYAHTPDALKNVLSTINEIRNGNEKLITVLGAGGDRDKTKRPEMASIAVELSTSIILTSDNPRSEDPEAILADMEKGIEAKYLAKALSITNRREAIKTACALAKEGDIILIAGKGHEKYQEVKGVRHHFDDKEVVNEFLNN